MTSYCLYIKKKTSWFHEMILEGICERLNGRSAFYKHVPAQILVVGGFQMICLGSHAGAWEPGCGGIQGKQVV